MHAHIRARTHTHIQTLSTLVGWHHSQHTPRCQGECQGLWRHLTCDVEVYYSKYITTEQDPQKVSFIRRLQCTPEVTKYNLHWHRYHFIHTTTSTTIDPAPFLGGGRVPWWGGGGGGSMYGMCDGAVKRLQPILHRQGALGLEH